MFVGHYAVGLAAKRLEPTLPLAWLLAAPQVLDLLWPIFVLSGVERVEVAPRSTAFTPLAFTHYPYSLVMTLVWSAAFGGLLVASRRPTRAAAIGALLVASHWVLDWVSHRPDMPVWPGGPRYGLGLWQSVPATFAVEGTMFAVGVGLYARSTTPRDRTGSVALIALVALLSVVYVGNEFGPPPPSARAVAASALALWLVPLWGAWIDRHRADRRRLAPR